MSKKKKHHEEHIDESWLVPYADILTLLLALFIVMFASSQLNQKKFDQMKQSFNTIFGGGSGIVDTMDGSDMFNPFELTLAAQETQKINEIVDYLDEQIEQSGFSDQIDTTITKEGLEISIQDKVLFNSGDAAVRSDVSPILSTIGNILKGIDNDIRVVGHTDNVPIGNAKFKSNWELSMMRAINVMNYFIETGSLNPERFVIQGHGKYKPKYDNYTEDGRAQNRRVEVVIVRAYPPTEDKNVPLLKETYFPLADN